MFYFSTASFLSKLKAKKVEKLCIFLVIKQLQQMTAYRKFWKWNIGFRNRERLFPVLAIIKKKIKNNNNADRPTLDFFLHVTVNTNIFLFGLTLILLKLPNYWIRIRFITQLVQYFNDITEETSESKENHLPVDHIQLVVLSTPFSLWN